MRSHLFVDIDGTLAVWREVEYAEQLFEKGYFRTLPTQQSVVDAVKILIEGNQVKTAADIDNTTTVYTLSAYAPESEYALREKKDWLHEVIPEIPLCYQLFCPCGMSKAKAVRRIYSFPMKDCILLDDYSANLHDWVKAGGRGIKVLNGINATKGSWAGPTVDVRWEPATIAMVIQSYIDNTYHEVIPALAAQGHI